MKRKIISWLTVLMFIFTAITQTRGVAAEGMPVSKITLADFSGGAIEHCSVMDKGYPTKEDVCTRAKLDTSVGYEGAQSSLMWQFGNHNGVLIKIPYSAVDWNACDTFNMRYYSEIPGQKVVTLVNEYDTFRSSADKNYWIGNAISGDGWQTLSINTSEIKVFWETDNPDYVYVLLISGWGLTTGSKEDFEAGKVNAITGEKMYIDKIWLSNSKYGAPMPAPVPSVENNSGFVSPELDGSNTFTLTYEKDIYAFDGAISVYETIADADSGIKYVESDIAYSVGVNQNKLNVVFEKPLPDNNYKIVALRDKVLSPDGEMAENDTEIYFSVGQESVLFNISHISFKDGDVFEGTPDEISLTFGTAPDKKMYVPDYIMLFSDGEKVYNAFSYELTDKTVKLIFKNPLPAGGYTLKISDSYSNVYGNAIMGNTEYDFEITSNEEPEAAKSIMMFCAGKASDMANVFQNSAGEVSEFSDIVNFYTTTAKLNCTSDAELVKKDKFNLSQMKYINYWIYAPESSGKVEFRLYTNHSSGTFAKYPYELTHSGWNLISLPLIDFRGDTNYDALGIAFNDEIQNGFVLIDAIWASKELPSEFEFVSSSFPDGYDEAALIGEVLELTYSGALSEDIKPVVSITDEYGNEFKDFKILVKSNVLRVEFGILQSETTYEIKAERVVSDELIASSPVSLKFTASDDGAYLEDISFGTDALKNECTNVTFLLANSGIADCEITLCAMAAGSTYNAGALVQKTVKIPGNTVIQTEVLKVAPNEATKAIKAFALLPSGKILSQKYYALGSSGAGVTPVSKDNSSGVKINSASLNINVLDVMLETINKSDTVIITVENGSGETVFADIAVSENNVIRKYFELCENAPDGEYTVKALCVSSQDEKRLSYISLAGRNAFLNAANNGKKEEVEEFIKSHAGVFGLENESSGLINEISELVVETGDFDVYADAERLICDAVNALGTVNNAVWSDFTEFIPQSAYLFGGEDDREYKYYMSLSEKNQNKICMKLHKKMPVDSLYELNSAFEDAIDNYKDSESGGNMGGSSGGGKKGSSGGAAVLSDLPQKEHVLYTPYQTATEFSDLADAAWAIESIMMLRENGVVSASADKLFRPNDSVTREEFIKLIICAFAPDMAESDYTFTDCPGDAWFASYVRKAHHLGILNGYPDGSFGAGENITREDMVTLIGRMLEALGYEINGGNRLEFTDAYAVSDYAGKYVAALTELEVINGMGNGTFAPKQTATRAQAAKVIAGLMEKY